jgi:hypothetical protein
VPEPAKPQPNHLARLAHTYRFLTLLRASLLLGALYDTVFAALMVLRPDALATSFALPLPPAFYLHLTAVLLLMLAAAYVLAARDPRRYSGVVAVAAGGRLLGAVALGLAALRPEWSGLALPAAADAAFGIAHAAFWWPLRG